MFSRTLAFGVALSTLAAACTVGSSPNGSSTGVQSGSAESVSRGPLFAPVRPVRAR
jgi:hypothetical protein